MNFSQSDNRYPISGITPEEFIKETNLDWEVNKFQNYIRVKDREIKSSAWTLAKVQKDEVFELGVAKDQYEPLQNEAIVKGLWPHLEKYPFKYIRGGQLRGGRKIFIQLDLDPVYLDGEIVHRSILIKSGHDGSIGFQIGTQFTPEVCKNRFPLFSNNRRLKMKHTPNIREFLSHLPFIVKYSMDEISRTEQAIELFRNTTMTQKDVEFIVYKLTLDKKGNGVILSENGSLENANGKIKARTHNLLHAINKERERFGNTFWGLFNGVTYAENHGFHVQERSSIDDLILDGQRGNEIASVFNELGIAANTEPRGRFAMYDREMRGSLVNAVLN
jgi:hypothetical protein